MDGPALRQRDLDGVEQCAAIAAGVPIAEVERRAAAAGHHESNAVANMMIEAEAVGTADELDAMTTNDVEVLRLPLAKATFGLGRVMTAQMGWGMQEHDAVRLARRGESLVEETKCLRAGACRVGWRRVPEVACLP